MDLRLPQVRVAPEEVESARRVLAEPVPAGMRESYDSHSEIETFRPPCCRTCGSDEVVRDGIGAGNQRRCEHCATAWTEMISEPG